MRLSKHSSAHLHPLLRPFAVLSLCSARPPAEPVACTGPCSTECITPTVPFVDWEASVCPKEGGTWSEQLVKDGRCTVRCHQPVGQQVILVCSGGKVVVDPKTPPCAEAAFWEVGYGACSVTCGSGYVPVHFRCSTGNDQDCESIGQHHSCGCSRHFWTSAAVRGRCAVRWTR